MPPLASIRQRPARPRGRWEPNSARCPSADSAVRMAAGTIRAGHAGHYSETTVPRPGYASARLPPAEARKLAIEIAREMELDGVVTTSNGDRAGLDKLARESRRVPRPGSRPGPRRGVRAHRQAGRHRPRQGLQGGARKKCRGWGSNPHGPHGPRDFKSRVSTSSTTSASVAPGSCRFAQMVPLPWRACHRASSRDPRRPRSPWRRVRPGPARPCWRGTRPSPRRTAPRRRSTSAPG